MMKRSDGIEQGETVRPDLYSPTKGGGQHPTYAGVLDLAIRLGLTRLTVEPVQIQDKENSFLAVMKAWAEFDDGTLWEDGGDASPASVSSQMVPSIVRMASTRAKGRVLRDACNVPQHTSGEAEAQGG